MARPRKDGLDYFPFDIDFFEDEKIEAISGEFGIKGEIIAIRLLCAVYRNGYFAVWTEMLKMKLAKTSSGISPELIEQIVNRLVKWGFFDKALFDSVRVLTSAGIQRRYFEAVRRRKSKGDKLPYLLVRIDDNCENVCNNGINVDNNGINVDINPQSKVKEIINNYTHSIPPKSPTAGSLFTEAQLKQPKREKNKPEEPKPPTLEDVKNAFLTSKANLRLRNWEFEAEQFFNYFNSIEWHDKNNRSILRNWISRANHWINAKEDEEKKSNQQKPLRNAATNPNWQSDADLAKQRRDESFAKGMRELLSNRDPGGAEMP